jgi:hypothetical protein
MRKDLINSLLIGGTIGLVALAIHAVTDNAAPHYQLLALVLAGAALFAVHLVLALRRKARAETDDGREQEAASLRHDPRNPFFRELTKDWTGLDDYPVDDHAPQNGSDAPAAVSRPPASRGEQDARASHTDT